MDIPDYGFRIPDSNIQTADSIAPASSSSMRFAFGTWEYNKTCSLLHNLKD